MAEENNDLFAKMTSMTMNMVEGYKNLSKVEDIDIATAPRTAVWEDGKVKLYHYESDTKTRKAKTPLLLVYALVNRPDMMDLQPDRSMIRRLLDQGIDVYLIDWGYADIVDRYKTMDDYINGNIDDCVNFVRKASGHDKINLGGICQGGTFSLIYTALHGEKIKNLITFVTPVNFETSDGALLFKWAKDMDVDALVDNFNGVVPGDYMNFGYDMLKPMSKVKKYMGFDKTLADEARLMNFLRMEKWVADSPDQAGETLRQFLKDMYQGNKLAKGEFELGGQKVDLKKITQPIMTIYAVADHIVPPECTKPINDLVGSKDKELYEFPGGHIGVFVGGKSQKILSPAIAKWLIDRDK